MIVRLYKGVAWLNVVFLVFFACFLLVDSWFEIAGFRISPEETIRIRFVATVLAVLGLVLAALLYALKRNLLLAYRQAEKKTNEGIDPICQNLRKVALSLLVLHIFSLCVIVSLVVAMVQRVYSGVRLLGGIYKTQDIPITIWLSNK